VDQEPSEKTVGDRRQPETTPADDFGVAPQTRTPAQDMVRLFFRNPLGIIGLAIIIAFAVVAVAAPWIAEYPKGFGDYADVTIAPSAAHPFGTDDLGLDILAQVVWGTRISLMVSLTAMMLSALIGVPLGLLAGYFKRRVDALVIGLIDLFLSLPVLPLIILAVAILGPGIGNIALILGLISWPQIAKITRGQSLSVSEQPYVEAARAVGLNTRNIVTRHVLPNCLPPIMVNMALTAARAVLSEAGLSFLGLGDPMHWSWGRILQQAYLSGSFIRAWWTTLFPSLAIFLFVLGLNFIGIALNEASNPRLRR